MGKFSKETQKQLIEHARQLYVKGFDADTIASILRISVNTVNRWAREHNFERSKRSQLIALSEIRRSILESYADMLEGRTPKIKPDDAAKYATAFERFSARKQVLIYMYEAFELLTEQYQRNIQTAATKQEKEQALIDLQKLRANMDIVINNLTNEVLGND
jgi:hypothetical protein